MISRRSLYVHLCFDIDRKPWTLIYERRRVFQTGVEMQTINTLIFIAVLIKGTCFDILSESKCAGNVWSVYVIEFI
jgi:hypothetical protein